LLDKEQFLEFPQGGAYNLNLTPILWKNRRSVMRMKKYGQRANGGKTLGSLFSPKERNHGKRH
jgi:hypothetical protein